jgi:hypothetical protein
MSASYRARRSTGVTVNCDVHLLVCKWGSSGDDKLDLTWRRPCRVRRDANAAVRVGRD